MISRFIAPVVPALAIISATLSVYACGRTGAVENAPELWNSAPPGGRRVIANAWDTLWSIGGNEADTTLLRPFLLASTTNGVFVYDGAAKRVTSYTPDGVPRWRFGRSGKGPDEFTKVRDMRVARDGGVDLLDPLNNRIMRLHRDGTVRARVPLTAVGYAEQMAPVAPDAFMLVTEHPGAALAVLDTAGALRSRFTLPWSGFERLEPLARQGSVASNGDHWVYAFSFGDGWFAYEGMHPVRFTGRFVEHTGFPHVKPVSTALGTGRKLDGYNACSACSVSMSGRTLYVHFGGYTGLAQRVVDLYDLQDGEYRGSWVLPAVTKAIEVQGNRVYVLIEDPYPQLMALRPRAGAADGRRRPSALPGAG